MHVYLRDEVRKLFERVPMERFGAVRREIHLAMLRLGRPVVIVGIAKPVGIEARFLQKADQREPVGA